jgi:hypothetical protein
MRVLVVGEGSHELGNPEIVGALPTLFLRLFARVANIECESVRSPKVRIHLRPGKGHGFLKRGLAWIRFAEREQFDALVFLIDEDGDSERPTAIDACQSEVRFSFPRAMGVAIRSFDAWILADEQALAKVLGIDVHRQTDPESNSDPKAACESLRTGFATELSPTIMYAQIAASADLELVAKRCPKGFAPFAFRVRMLAGGP